MPSTATITSFYSFTAGTLIRSADVNTNFSNFRGHILPVDPSSQAAAATNTYDLGALDHRWRHVFGKVWSNIASTSGATTLVIDTHDAIMFDTTAATITCTLPTAANNTGTSFFIKNIGTAGKTLFIDGNGSETIDATLTVNLVDYESVKLIAHGGNWWIF